MYHRKRLNTKYYGGQFPPTYNNNPTFGVLGPPPPMWHYFYNQPVISSFQPPLLSEATPRQAPPTYPSLLRQAPPGQAPQQPAMNRTGPVYLNNPRLSLTSREELLDNDYEKRRRNAEAAARHREKKKLTDKRLLQRFNVLLKRQKELQTEVLEKQHQLSRLKLAFFRDRERAEGFTTTTTTTRDRDTSRNTTSRNTTSRNTTSTDTARHNTSITKQ